MYPQIGGTFGGTLTHNLRAYPQMPLTDAKVKNLLVGPKPYKVSDFDGLFVLVKTSGSKSWRFKYRMEGSEKLLVIGDYPSVSLLDARRIRDAARAEVAKGVDPNEAKQDAKRLRSETKANTFAIQADAFIAKAEKEGKAPATMAKTGWLVGMTQADFGSRPIAEITSPLILKRLRKVQAMGNYETARRLRVKIGAVFRYAIANGVAETDPPGLFWCCTNAKPA